MVGISHPSFKTAIELVHFSETLGAAAVQVLAPLRPFGGAPTERDLVAYFEALGRETALPITLYLNSGHGAEVSIPTTIARARLPKVRFIKESSRDLSRVGRLVVSRSIMPATPAISPECLAGSPVLQGGEESEKHPLMFSADRCFACQRSRTKREYRHDAPPRLPL